MAVRSQLLAHRTSVLWNVAEDLFVVPTGRTAIIKMITLGNFTGGTLFYSLAVRRGTARAAIARETAAAADSILRLVGLDLVLNPGDAFSVLLPVANTGSAAVHVTVSGVLLAGAPT